MLKCLMGMHSILLDKVGDRHFETVFVTAYNHYAIDALNAHASYYLLKPISIDNL